MTVLKKPFLVLSLTILLLQSARAGEKIHWLSITQAEQLCHKTPRKIFIDIYTGWCGWCKKLDAETYSDSGVAAYINAHFYPVKLDAETRDTILYQNKTFTFNPAYKVNMVSYEFCDNSGYPTLSFLNEKQEKLMQWPGFLNPQDMMVLLRYFGENYYKKYEYNAYLTQVVKKDNNAATAPMPPGMQGAKVMKEAGKLIATTGSKYQWYNDKGPIEGATSMVFVPDQTGTYYYVATDDSGNMLPPSQSVLFEFDKAAYKKALKDLKQ